MNTSGRGRGPWYGVALLTLSGVWLSGCGSELDDAPSDLEHHQSATAFCNKANGCCDPALYEDCSNFIMSVPGRGAVGVTTYRCFPTASSTAPSATCRVDSGDQLIGGGAFAIDASNIAITKSLPILGLGGGWSAQSAGISGSVRHRLRTYAIGLQVLNSSLRPVDIGGDIHEHIFFPTSSGSRASGFLPLPSDQVLVGGGWSAGAGTFAVDAYATGMLGGKWNVNGTRLDGGVANIIGAAMGVSRCVPSSSPIACFSHRDIIEATSPDGTSTQAVLVANPHSDEFIVGAGLISSSWSRPISALFAAGPGPSDSGLAVTQAPTGDLGHVTAQVMTMGF